MRYALVVPLSEVDMITHQKCHGVSDVDKFLNSSGLRLDQVQIVYGMSKFGGDYYVYYDDSPEKPEKLPEKPGKLPASFEETMITLCDRDVQEFGLLYNTITMETWNDVCEGVKTWEDVRKMQAEANREFRKEHPEFFED